MAQPFSDTDLDAIVHGLGDVASDFAGRTVLLAGSRGFLGGWLDATFTHLNRRLDTPVRVIALDNLVASSMPDGPDDRPAHRFVQHDIVEPFDPGEPVDFVLHAAGIASPRHYRARPLETIDVATRGTRNLLDLAQAHQARLLFLSSSEIYGDPDAAHVPTREDYRGHVACQGPRACYDESKRLGETLCDVFHTHHGVHTTIVRPFNVYGPGMREDDFRVLPNFASRIVGDAPLEVYGDGRQTRTYCYVVDAIVGILRVLARGAAGRTFNVGNPEPEVSVNVLVERTQAVVDRPVQAHFTPYPDSYPADEPQRRCPDIARAHDEVGYTPQVDLDEGLRRFYAWALTAYEGLRAHG